MHHFLLVLTFSLAVFQNVMALPFLPVDNPQLRSDIERISRAGLLNLPLSSWPLSQAAVRRELDKANQEEIPAELIAVVNRVRMAINPIPPKQLPQVSMNLSASKDPAVLRSFGDTTREQLGATLNVQGSMAGGYYQLATTIVKDPLDEDNTRFDGSHITYLLGDWWLTAGAIERWWGPGWASSLVFSNNARPVPGLSLQRSVSDPSELPVLNLLGPWSATAFIGQMDDERAINQAKLLGLSVAFKPHPRVEIALHRTAQWGGEGRPQSASNLLKLITGRGDNCYDSECREDEPGNQLGGIDVRLELPKFTLYGQLIGEDEANAWPAKKAWQLGVSGGLQALGLQGSWYIEQSDTRCASSKASGYNCFYNHSIYQSGYRYQGRAIGASWDNDSRVLSAGATLTASNGDIYTVKLHNGELNRDSLASSEPSLHSIAPQGAKLRQYSLAWQRPTGWGEWSLGADYSSQRFDEFGRQTRRAGFEAAVTYYWNQR